MKKGKDTVLTKLVKDYFEEHPQDYILYMTEAWHDRVPETRDYQVCSRKEATHVIFTEMDLEMGGEDGKDFTPSKIYRVNWDYESEDLYIEDDKRQAWMGFDLHIPCEYLKKIESMRALEMELEPDAAVIERHIRTGKVVSLEAFRKERMEG